MIYNSHDHMLHRTGLLTEAQVRGSKALGSFATSDLCLRQQPSSMKHMIMTTQHGVLSFFFTELNII